MLQFFHVDKKKWRLRKLSRPLGLTILIQVLYVYPKNHFIAGNFPQDF